MDSSKDMSIQNWENPEIWKRLWNNFQILGVFRRLSSSGAPDGEKDVMLWAETHRLPDLLQLIWDPAPEDGDHTYGRGTPKGTY